MTKIVWFYCKKVYISFHPKKYYLYKFVKFYILVNAGDGRERK